MKKVFFMLLCLTMIVTNGFTQSILEEGFEGSQMPPAGWTVYESSMDLGWHGWLRSTTAHSGTYAAYVDFADPGHTSYLITPQLSLTGHKILSFWYAINYPDYADATTFTVELSTTGNNITDFSVLETVTLNSSSYSNMVIDLAQYSGQNIYIAFHVEDGYGVGVYIDDVHVYDLPTCDVPTGVAVSNIGLNSATVTWNAESGASGYIVECMDIESPDLPVYVDTVNGNTAVLSGLMSATDYSVRVRSICSDGSTSIWSTTASFVTSCLPITVTLDEPWTEGFEEISGAGTQPLISCWGATQRSASYNSPYIYCGWAPAAHSGLNSLVLRGNANEINTVLLPEFSNPVNTLQMSYFASTTASTVENAGTIEVGYVTDITNAFSFVPIVTVLPKDSSLSRVYSAFYGPFNFVNAPENASRIAIRFISNTSGTSGISWNLDDFVVSIRPDCSAPGQFSVMNVSSTAAELRWLGSETVPYDVLYWVAGSTDTTVLANVSYVNGSYELGGLSSNTSYECLLRTVCENGTVMYSTNIVSFTTLSNALQLPYFNDFEEDPSAYSEFDIFGIGINQWTIGSATGNPGSSLYISDDNGVSNHYTHLTAQVSESSHSYAVVNVTFPQNSYEYHLSFDYKVVGEATYDMFYVYMANSNATVTPGQLPPGAELIGAQANVPEWRHVDFTLPNVNGSTKQIIFYWVNDNLFFNNPPVAVDNISIDYFACPQPTNLYVSGVSADAATLHWTDNSNSSWVVYYKPAYSEEPYHEEIVNDGTNFTFEHLYSNTYYDCYVVANCDDGNYSSPSVHYQFRTSCGGGIGTLPYVEGFDDYVWMSGSNYVPCWNRLGSSPQHYAYVNISDFGNNCLDFHYTPNCFTMAVLPRLADEISTNSVVLEFDAQRQSLGGTPLEVGVLTDPNDATTFEVLSTISFSSSHAWEHKVVYCDHYSGNGSYLAFRVNNAGNQYVIVDNVIVDFLPNCLPANNLSVSNVSLHEATLSWSGSSFEYGISLFGADTAYYVVSDTFLVLSGLNPSSSYGFKVESYCGSDTATFSEVKYFFTECGNISVSADNPWFENFEAYQGEPETAIGFTPCWATPLTFTATNGVFPTVYNFASATHSGTNMVEIKGYETMVVLPSFSTVLSNLRLSFWATTSSNQSGYNGLMEVGVVNGTNPTTFVPVDTVVMTAFSLTGNDSPHCDLMGPYDFSGVSAGPYSRMAIRYHSNDEYTSCYLDDFTVSLIPDCPSPSKTSVVVSNVTESTADISWIDHNASHTQWTVYYKKSSDDDDAWMTMSANSTSTTLYNLESNTSYDAYVVTNCGTPGTDATRTVHFTTSLVPTAIPYTTDFTNTDEWNLNNSSCENRWKIGTVDTDLNALFVTNNGVTPGYDAYSAALVTAEKLFAVGTDAEFHIEFDVKVGGEGNSFGDYDYMKVFFAPATAEYNACDPIEYLPDWVASDYSVNAVNFAEYLNQSASNNSIPYKFSLTGGNTVHVSVNMPNPILSPTENSIAKLVFVWFNDIEQGTQPAAIISNLSVSKVECPQPVNVVVDNVGPNSADMYWTGSPDAAFWTLSFKAANESEWTEISVTSPTYHFSDLTALTTYTVQLQSACGDSEFSSITYTSFLTPACETTDQCIYTFDLTDSWGDGWNGAYISVMQSGVAIATVTLNNGNSSTQTVGLCNNENISLVWNSGAYDQECAFSLIGPDGITVYSVNDIGVSTGTSLYNFMPNCSDSTVCMAPTSLSVSNVGPTSVQLTWAASVTATSWILEYKTTGSTTWLPAVPVSTNSYQLSSLTPSTTYVVHVKSVCGNEGESEWSQNQIFSTSSASAGLTVVTLQPTDIAENSATLNGEISNPDNQSITSCGFEWKATGSGSYSSAMTSISNVMSYTLNGLLPNTSYTYRAFVITAEGNHYGEEMTFSTTAELCPTPINVNQLGVTNNSLMVVWTNLAPASEWEIRYRPEGGDWLTVTVTNVTYFNLANLASGTTYEVQVRAICDEEHSSNWSASAFFTTNSLDDYLMGKIALYPNPAKAYVDVRFSDNDINMTDIEVYDVYGKLLYMTAVSDNPTRIDVSKLASGLYFVKVITDKGTATKTFVKQ